MIEITKGTTVTLPRLIDDFLLDRKVRGRSLQTLAFYQKELTQFERWARDHESLDPGTLRLYLSDLGSTRNPGGVHCAFRTLRAFFRWVREEWSTEDWDPMKGVTIPTTRLDPLPGVPVKDVLAMVDTCGRDWMGRRDRAILLTLLDTGVRRGELLALNLEDLDLKTGDVLVRSGKGNKPRIVFMGATVRRDLGRYLRVRGDLGPKDPVWVTRMGTRLKPRGLETMIAKRAQLAGVNRPGVHDFRRTFALESLRNGIDVYSLMRIMGHASPDVLLRYLALLTDDVRTAHHRTSPVDRV